MEALPASAWNLPADVRKAAKRNPQSERHDMPPRAASSQLMRLPHRFERTGAKPEATLVVLGTAQVGTAAQWALLDLPDLHATPLHVHIASKNGSVGPAYESRNENRLLNAVASAMTFGDESLPFPTWVKQNEDALCSEGLLEKNPAGYASSNLRRVVYGRYLLDRRPDILAQLARRSLSLDFRPDDPAVTAWPEGNKTHVALQSGHQIAADALFDGIGGFEAKVKDRLDEHPAVKAGHVLHISTYDSERLRQIPDGSDVFFRGFRLGALDHFEQGGLIDRLAETGGTVTFSSRTGGMSPVSGKKSLFVPQAFTLERLDDLVSAGQLNPASLKALIQEETDRQCRQHGMARFDIDACRNPFKNQPASPEEFTRTALETLKNDIAAAKGGPMTPSVLLSNVYGSIYPVVCEMFHTGMVPASEHEGCHQITTWPAQVPVQIAEKMLRLGEQGKLKLFAGVADEPSSSADAEELVFTSSYRGVDGKVQSHARSPKYIINATGGFNDIIRDIQASGDVFRSNAIANGVYRAYEGESETGRRILLGGIDHEPRTRLAVGLGNVGVAGSITAGKDKLPPSGTAKKIAQDARLGITSAVRALGQKTRAMHSPAKLEREEVFSHSDRLFEKLPGLLASEELRLNGKIERDSLRLLLPDREQGEPVFRLEQGVQFAGFTGISRAEAGPRIGRLDDHIVWQMVPKEKSTPLCYLSEKVEDERGNAFWVNLVLWREQQMGPTQPNARQDREKWTPDARAKHMEAVFYALFGTPADVDKRLPPLSSKKFFESAEPPAFEEVHFMNGPIDAAKQKLQFEEHRHSLTQLRAEGGELIPGVKQVDRLKSPVGLPYSAAARWVTVAREQLKDPRRAGAVDGSAADLAVHRSLSKTLAAKGEDSQAAASPAEVD